jgi:hypothetical protein
VNLAFAQVNFHRHVAGGSHVAAVGGSEGDLQFRDQFLFWNVAFSGDSAHRFEQFTLFHLFAASEQKRTAYGRPPSFRRSPYAPL